MTFGLCNAPATFQRLMEEVLYDLSNKICAIYLDDILIWSSSLDEHLERLDAVFKRLADAGLKLKPSKCSFFKDKVGYLGYVISSNGVETDPRLLQSHHGRYPRIQTTSENFLASLDTTEDS